jgi:hypothetical protein
MAFNFGSLATTPATSTSKPRLKPWGIYPVKFVGARKETITGKKDPSATYEVLKVRFEGEDGFYEESIFFPKEGDDIRPTYTSKDGHEYQGISSFERTMTFIAQVAQVLNPEGWQKMRAISSKFKSFDDVVSAFIKVTDPAKDKETNIKLIGKNSNGTVNASLPKFAAVSKEGELFVTDNFIGDKLFFTPYEESKKQEYYNAAPTNMGDNGIAGELNGADSGDIDFDTLL